MDIMINNKHKNSPFIYEVCATCAKVPCGMWHFSTKGTINTGFFYIFYICATWHIGISGTKFAPLAPKRHVAFWAETACTQHANRKTNKFFIFY